jgi:hypothetical protein
LCSLPTAVCGNSLTKKGGIAHVCRFTFRVSPDLLPQSAESPLSAPHGGRRSA